MKTVFKLMFIGYLFILIFSSSCTTINAGHSDLPGDIPMDKDAGRGGHLFLNVRLKGGIDLPFVLDTGTAITFFDKSLEKQLGRKIESGSTWLFGTNYNINYYDDPGLFLGKTVLMKTGIYIATLDCKKLSAESGHPVKGIIGMDILANYCLQLDFVNKKIRFLDDESLDKGSLGMPFLLVNIGDGRLAIDDNLLGLKGIGSLVDTGSANDGWLRPELFTLWTNQLSLPNTGEAHSPFGILGNEIYPDINLAGFDTSSSSGGPLPNSINGIGLRFLSRHLVTLDFPKHTMYLKRMSTGPLIDSKLGQVEGKSAFIYLRKLKEGGQLPGWRRNDKSATNELSCYFQFPNILIFDLVKKGDSSTYHYQVVPSSNRDLWRIQKAWRTDNNGQLIQEYSIH